MWLPRLVLDRELVLFANLHSGCSRDAERDPIRRLVRRYDQFVPATQTVTNLNVRSVERVHRAGRITGNDARKVDPVKGVGCAYFKINTESILVVIVSSGHRAAVTDAAESRSSVDRRPFG